MPTIYINRGFSGSGKSTATEKAVREGKNIVAVNRDYLRKMTAGVWWPADEKFITKIQTATIEAAIADGKDIIVDDTFIEEKYVENMRQLAKRLGANFVVNDKFLTVSVDKCIERDAARDRSVGKDVIENQYYRYWAQKSKPDNYGLKQAIIVDIDGTLAHTPGADHITGITGPGKYPYDRDMRLDPVDFNVNMLIGAMSNKGYDIILVSGRDGDKRDQTEQWLAMNAIPYDRLYMREARDKRSDVLVKKEIYMQEIQGNWRIEFVLDDRPAVVRMWRAELGLKVLQVAPNLEF